MKPISHNCQVNPDARRRGTFFDFALVFPSPSGNRGGSARNAQVMSSGPLGEIAADVDVTFMPFPLAPAVQPGQTYHFQVWYRDLNPGATSNFSPGLSVTFQ